MTQPPNYGDAAQHAGQRWRRVETLPRLLAEGWRRDLEGGGVVSALMTPSGWSFSAPIYEIVAGIYLGDVALYVPEVQYGEALEVLGIEDAELSIEDAELGLKETLNAEESGGGGSAG